MSLLELFLKRRITGARQRHHRRSNRFRPTLEQLEERRVLSTVLLSSSLDNIEAIVQPRTGVGGTTTLMAEDFAPGRFETAASFVGAGKVVRFPAATAVRQNIELDHGEIEFWYRPNYAPGDDDVIHALVVVGDIYGAGRISVTESDALHLTVVTPDWSFQDVQSDWHAPLWQAGQWVHIRAAWDSTASSDALQLYVDGVRVDRGGAVGSWTAGAEESMGSIFVGSGNANGEFAADGMIDELLIRAAITNPESDPAPDPQPNPRPEPDPEPDPGTGTDPDPGATPAEVVSPPSPRPRPPVGAPFTDPEFGTTLTRVSDTSERGGFETHLYSQLQAFSSDNAYLLLVSGGSYVVRRMNDFSLVSGLDSSSWNAPRWHPIQSHRLVHFDTNDDTDVTLQITDVDTQATTDLFEFPPRYQYVRVNQSFDELSDDGRWLAGMLTRADGASVLFALDVENRVLGAELAISELYAGACAPDPEWGVIEPDWVGVSPLGRYLAVQWPRDGTARCSGLETFDIRSGEFVGRVYDGHQHGDLGVMPDGVTEFFMTFELAAPPPNNDRPAIAIRELPGNRTASAPQFLSVLDWGNAEHISCRGPNGTCVVTAGTLADNGWNPFEGEVFIQRTDGSVQRLAHHRSSSCGYWVQPRASMSRDGRYVVFASDWAHATGTDGCDGGDELGRGDPYVIGLEATADTEPPEDIDDVPPSIVDLHLQSSRQGIGSIVLQFSEAMNTGSIENLSNYQLTAAGRDKRIGTRDDRPIPLRSVRYDETSWTVTIRPRQRLAGNQLYQLTVLSSPAVSDLAGNVLDGDWDGAVGGDFISSFLV